MKTAIEKIRLQKLVEIKQIVEKDKDGDRFHIERREKNMEFIREYGLTDIDIKNIIKGITLKDCFSGPEQDRNIKYKGWIFKFQPMFEGIKLYVKIRVENKNNATCISVHEFGKYEVM